MDGNGGRRMIKVLWSIMALIIIFALGIFAGYNLAMRNIYGWMSDILKPIPPTPENKDFLWGVIFAQEELDKKIRHVKEKKEDEED